MAVQTLSRSMSVQGGILSTLSLKTEAMTGFIEVI